MKKRFSKPVSGYTLVEFAVTIGIVAVLAGTAMVVTQGSSEARDAAMVQSAQGVLQQVVAQASARQDLNPRDLNNVAVANAFTHIICGDQTGGCSGGTSCGGMDMATIGANRYAIRFNTGRQAVFEVSDQGTVLLLPGPSAFKGFTTYSVVGGVIKKN